MAKINKEKLRAACERMSRLLDDEQPGLMSWHILFNDVANEIRFELDGNESCVPAVRERALRED